ncbi:methyltransferase domain-containing protein [Streptomyces pseudovenezuelae]|uniref:methyltransferase domain-containing protein n=1 Tax=Streptomyces pseudovenezuelae TaxID=67350 RepID=UPI002E2EE7FA|nr:methyltransferase domain-containing protein [Streptomyces pseudovenezuelae]
MKRPRRTADLPIDEQRWVLTGVSRVTAYTHLRAEDLVKPRSARVFFDPADTETGIWAAQDLITKGCGVLDLGSGSGAAAAAMARAGARVHGVDRGAETVSWASEHYASRSAEPQVTFAQGDFSTLSAEELTATVPGPLPRPLIITTNPPYVPLPAETNEPRPSINGGTDGLRLLPAIIEHCRALRSDLALTIGSYSTPRKAARLLTAAGLHIQAITLCPIALGEFTLSNMEQVRDLETKGEAVLWRRTPLETPAYFALGLACRWNEAAGPRKARPARHWTGEDLIRLLRAAASSRAPRLEALDSLLPEDRPGPVRVLDLPAQADRHHW